MIAHDLSIPFGNVYATWVCLLERASQVSYGGRFCEYCNDEFKSEIAFQLGYQKSDVEKIIYAFNGKLINQNTIKNWERHQIDPTNKDRQLKYRDKSSQSNGNNSDTLLYNGVTIEERRGEEIREEEKENDKKKKRVSLEDLSINHIAEWLCEKRAAGKYINHDEKFILEYFKNYCTSKEKRYKDYVAALRNAFEWDSCQPKGYQNGNFKNSTGKTKAERANEAMLRAIADISLPQR
jgi:hypothetical protein